MVHSPVDAAEPHQDGCPDGKHERQCPKPHPARTAEDDYHQTHTEDSRGGGMTGRKARRRRCRVQARYVRARPIHEEVHGEEHEELEHERDDQHHCLAHSTPKREHRGDDRGEQDRRQRVHHPCCRAGDVVPGPVAVRREPSVDCLVPASDRTVEHMGQEQADDQRGEHDNDVSTHDHEGRGPGSVSVLGIRRRLQRRMLRHTSRFAQARRGQHL